MALERGTELSDLVAALKAEIGDYSGTNTARDASLAVLLANKQDELAIMYHWSYLEDRWNKDVAPATQYVAWPTVNERGGSTTPDVDQLTVVEVKWASQYLEVKYGIGIEEYNAFDFSEGQSCDPIQRWREAPTVTQEQEASQFEVWPVPNTVQTMRFTGQRMLTPLVDTDDECDLDGLLLVLGVAADVLGRNKQQDAASCRARFETRLLRLGAKNQTKDKNRSLCGGGDAEFERSRKRAGLIIAVH